MSQLTLRRLMVWVISTIVGTLIGYLIMAVALPLLSPDPNARGIGSITIDEFGRLYFITMVIPLILTVMTWLDAWLDTRIWPD
ncbi:MAG: hypothetical protein MUF87_06450 [Anaerolineae bacterium]|jgi:hypothetical protein|nr:hypothetical protein [Anaerolineae bacterium]